MDAVWTSGTIVAAFGSLTNSHCAPTVCPHVPTLEITTPSHSQKNTRCRNGAKGDRLVTSPRGVDVTIAVSFRLTTAKLHSKALDSTPWWRPQEIVPV